MPTQQPKILRASWEAVPSIFSTIQSYTSAVEWFCYLTFISHILCKSDSAHIAKANLIYMLRARPTVQMWHEALLSEMHDEDEPNLPSILEVTDFLNPSVQEFQRYTMQRFELMTKADVFVARCVVVDFIYRNLDDAQAAAEAARNAKQKSIIEEQGRIVRQQEEARQPSQALHLCFGSTKEEKPAAGQIGIRDLAALVAGISLQLPAELSVPIEPVPVVVVAPTQKASWVKGLVRCLAQLASRPMTPASSSAV